MNVLMFVIGACVGSFINACVYRTAVKYKLLDLGFKIKDNKRSYCDWCGKQLSWFDNIPVVSWLMLKGKSRCCGEKLPILYPIVEIVTGLLFLQIISLNFQSIVLLMASMAIVGFLVFSTVFDLRYMILPDFSTIALLVLTLIYKVLLGGNMVELGVGVLIGISAFGFFHFLHTLTGGEGMGYGDVKLAFFMGLLLGWPGIVVGLYVAFVVGAIVGLVVLAVFKNNKKIIPFGPFMILGSIVAWWWGEAVWNLVNKVLY